MTLTKENKKSRVIQDYSILDHETMLKIRVWEYEFQYGDFKPDPDFIFPETPGFKAKRFCFRDDRIERMLCFYDVVGREIGDTFLHCPAEVVKTFAVVKEETDESELKDVGMFIGHSYQEYYKFLCYGEMIIHHFALHGNEGSQHYQLKVNRLLEIATECGLAYSELKDKDLSILLRLDASK